MNVYVESNFVLEHALEREQCESCEELVRIARGGSIRLFILAFSLAEPHIALLRKQNKRSRLGTELQQHLRELGRSALPRIVRQPQRTCINSDQECGRGARWIAEFDRWNAQGSGSNSAELRRVLPSWRNAGGP